MEWITLLPQIMSIGMSISSAIETGVSVNSIGTLVKDPQVSTILQTLGARLFPKAAPEIALAGSMLATYSPNYVKWLQGMLNAYLKPNPLLAVDGSYGPKTIAAVQAAQTKLGIKVDGVAGDLTMAALNYFLNPPAQKTA